MTLGPKYKPQLPTVLWLMAANWAVSVYYCAVSDRVDSRKPYIQNPKLKVTWRDFSACELQVQAGVGFGVYGLLGGSGGPSK